MRHVTGITVFSDRCVLPQKWATLFGMAFVALFINRVCRDELLGNGAMRIVTFRARHLSFPNRVVGRFLKFGTDILVTLRAHFGLSRFDQVLLIAGVRIMAIGAAHIAAFMLAALPQGQLASFVTFLAGGRAHWLALFLTIRLYVFKTGSMAGFAALDVGRGSGIQLVAMIVLGKTFGLLLVAVAAAF